MTLTLCHKFIAAIEPARDSLYAHALAKTGAAARAEAALQQAARDLFVKFSREPDADVPSAMEILLRNFPETSPPPPPAETPTPMPADVWARLAAAVQVEAARSSNALNPDSTLLSPDPLLAPRKKSAHNPDDDRPPIPSPRQILLWAAIAIVLGMAITLYIVTRNSPSTSRPANSPAAPASSTSPPASAAGPP